MNKETKEKIENWIKWYGKVTIPFLQMKLNVSYDKAKKYIDILNKEKI